MPNYKITIYLKSGKQKTGIRYHSSTDTNLIRSIVLIKHKKADPFEPVDWIDVVPTALGGSKIETKNL